MQAEVEIPIIGTLKNLPVKDFKNWFTVTQVIIKNQV